MKTYKNACLIPRGREELARLVLEGGQSIAGRKSLSRLRQDRKWAEQLILNAGRFAAVFEFPFPYSPHVDKECQNSIMASSETKTAFTLDLHYYLAVMV
ncbi:MAG: hypothetical protein ACR650_13360 [Methylocystis sp.]